MNNNIPPFYVGQKVICVDTTGNPPVKKNKEYTVDSVTKGCCGWEITVGIQADSSYDEVSFCRKCGSRTPSPGSTWPLRASRFRALTETFQPISFSKVLDEVLTSSN
jgi:hypothetical protein